MGFLFVVVGLEKRKISAPVMNRFSTNFPNINENSFAYKF